MTTLATDPLVGTATLQLLTAYSPNWTRIGTPDGATTLNILTAGIVPRPANSNIGLCLAAYWNANAVGADQWVQITVTNIPPSSNNIGVILRGSVGTGGTCYQFFFSSANYTLSSFVNGVVAHNIVGQTPHTFANGDVIYVGLQGWTFTINQNGVLLATATDSFHDVATGQPGILCRDNTAGAGNPSQTNGCFTTFSAGDFSTGPTAPTTAKGAFTVRTTNQP